MCEDLPRIGALALGFAFACLLGWPMVGWLNSAMRGTMLGEGAGVEDKSNWEAAIVGLIERALYLVALQLGRVEFIGLWLIIKAVGQWASTAERRRYQIFLACSGFSLLYAVVGFKLIGWAAAGRWLIAVAAALLTVIFTAVAAVFAYPPAEPDGKAPAQTTDTGKPPVC